MKKIILTTVMAITLAMMAVPRSYVSAGAMPGKAISARGAFNPLQQTTDPSPLSRNAALSASLGTALIRSGNGNSEVRLLADIDGSEDRFSDHEARVSGLPDATVDPQQEMTRVAISEHTLANGFDENIFYSGDSAGNVYIGADTTGDAAADLFTTISIPAVLSAFFGSLSGANAIAITGLAVNPVADLTSFSRVNAAYSTFNGQIGEILYIAYWDSSGTLHLNNGNQVVRSGLLAVPVSDLASPAGASSGVVTSQGFPVTAGRPWAVAFSSFGNLAGVCVDDDGNAYFQQSDLLTFTASNIVKVTSLDAPGTGDDQAPGFQDRALVAQNPAVLTSLNPGAGDYGKFGGTPSNQINRLTNYSGTSPTFGNIVSLACGPGNIVYAAVARSVVDTDDQDTEVTEGRFRNPVALGPTPSMVISFADCAGALNTCISPDDKVSGTLPVADGFADVAATGLTLSSGVNNFRVFVLGNGPEIRAAGSVIGAEPANTLKLDMQIDFSILSGLVVDEESKVYVISGGAPADSISRGGASPLRGEILSFEDAHPIDRRGDFVDFRQDTLTAPTITGDGDSDRFDHIFWQAPTDAATVAPAGLSGLARGFLLYLNRARKNAAQFPSLPNGAAQADDAATGPIVFESFDPSHQVAGGDGAVSSSGDDSGGEGEPIGEGNPSVSSPSGGFEFLFSANAPSGNPFGCLNRVWNAFFLNSNGNITFGSGDTDATPTIEEFREPLARLAPAWADLNPASRAEGFAHTFPVQALGFADVNDFVIRWINVPESGGEACGSSNTFSVFLFDDGQLADENAASGVTEGPLAPRFNLLSHNTREAEASAFRMWYGRMDLLGTPDQPVIVGYSNGGPTLLSSEPDSTNWSTLAPLAETSPIYFVERFADAGTFQLFNSGTEPALNEGQVIPAKPSFDLRGEGNAAALCTPDGQTDLNRATISISVICSQVVVDPPPPGPVINSCKLKKTAMGGFKLIVTGTDFTEGITVTVGGVTPKKVKLKDPVAGAPNNFTKLILKGRICQGLPGAVVVVNPGPNGGASQPFACIESCQ